MTDRRPTPRSPDSPPEQVPCLWCERPIAYPANPRYPFCGPACQTAWRDASLAHTDDDD